MKKTNIKIIMTLVMFGVFLITNSNGFCENIKERMKERLTVIKQLKIAGVVGENNRGYLEIIGNNRENEDIVKAENSDRKQIYESIATMQKVSVESVGSRRAMQIFDKAEPGEWLQHVTGKWIKKQ